MMSTHLLARLRRGEGVSRWVASMADVEIEGIVLMGEVNKYSLSGFERADRGGCDCVCVCVCVW